MRTAPAALTLELETYEYWPFALCRIGNDVLALPAQECKDPQATA